MLLQLIESINSICKQTFSGKCIHCRLRYELTTTLCKFVHISMFQVITAGRYKVASNSIKNLIMHYFEDIKSIRTPSAVKFTTELENRLIIILNPKTVRRVIRSHGHSSRVSKRKYF